MRLTSSHSGYNPWFVDHHEIRAIVIFDKSGPLLTVERGWLEAVTQGAGGYRHATTITDIAEVEEIRNRRSVDYDRLEHFVVNRAGFRTLYLCASLFGGYSTVNELPAFDNAITVSMIYSIDLHMSVNGKDADWVRIDAARTHTQVDKPNAAMVRAVMEYYNSKVPDHPNRNIGECAALRLVEELPELARLAGLSL